MITSQRKFGVEVEFVAPSHDALMNIASRIHVVPDGSLRPIQNTGEYVSAPIKGKVGERTIREACDVMNKYKASCENPKTSIHVHLDGRVGEGVLRTAKNDPKVNNCIAISNRLRKDLKSSDVLNIMKGRAHMVPNADWNEYRFDGVSFLSKAQLTRKPRLNYTYYWLDKENRFEWLRNVFYFYVKYSDVMEGIVSPSRKFGNMYCIPLGSSYSLEEIADTKSMDELKSVWYKHRPIGGNYDYSRYHDVNLHCFWHNHGTVEIRSHGGTTNADKILLWLKLHQKIVDKLEEISIDELKLLTSDPTGFINFVEEPLLKDYVKRLQGFYSGINS